MGYVSDYEAKKLICEYGRKLYARGLVDGNGGNISIKVSPDEIWVTPTMQSKGDLIPEMLIKMDLEGNILNRTEFRPSSETKMHIGLYKQNDRIKTVVHAHPPYATAFAIAGIAPPATYLPEATLFFGDTIPLADFAMPGTEDMAKSLEKYANTAKAALLKNHGAITWNTDIKEAYFMMETLENYCRVYMYATKFLGQISAVAEEDTAKILIDHEKIMW